MLLGLAPTDSASLMYFAVSSATVAKSSERCIRRICIHQEDQGFDDGHAGRSRHRGSCGHLVRIHIWLIVLSDQLPFLRSRSDPPSSQWSSDVPPKSSATYRSEVLRMHVELPRQIIGWLAVCSPNSDFDHLGFGNLAVQDRSPLCGALPFIAMSSELSRRSPGNGALDCSTADCRTDGRQTSLQVYRRASGNMRADVRTYPRRERQAGHSRSRSDT